MRDNGGTLENLKARSKHFLQLRTAQLMSDMLRRLNVPAHVSKSIHDPFISGGDDKVAADFQGIRRKFDVHRLILDMRYDFLGNDDIKEILGKIRLINVPGLVLNVWAASLGGSNAVGGQVNPVCFAEIRKTLGEPTATTTEIQDARFSEIQAAYQPKNLLSPSLGPSI